MNNNFPQRKRIRLKGYDYTTPGYYFITICTDDRENHFGVIKNGNVILTKAGEIVKKVWDELPLHYNNCELDTYIVMPNHFHGIIKLKHLYNEKESIFLPLNEKKCHGLSEIIRGFKTFSSKRINEELKLKQNQKFKWQKSYYDIIIRNEQQLENIRNYIIDNPLKWESNDGYLDDFNDL